MGAEGEMLTKVRGKSVDPTANWVLSSAHEVERLAQRQWEGDPPSSGGTPNPKPIGAKNQGLAKAQRGRPLGQSPNHHCRS
eukprot:361967-Chlamydomonas_euryale.AAC.4